MGIFHRHIPSMKRLEERVKNQEFRLEETHKKAEALLQRLEKLEIFVIKNFGEKQGEQILAGLSKELAYINQRISMNEFEEVMALLTSIEARLKSKAYSEQGIAYS